MALTLNDEKNLCTLHYKILHAIIIAETKQLIQEKVLHLTEREKVSEKFELLHCYDNNRKIRN